MVFDYSNHPQNSVALEPLVGQGGILLCRQLSISGAEQEDFLLLAGFTDQGDSVPSETLVRLLSLPASQSGETLTSQEQQQLDHALASLKDSAMQEVEQRYGLWFEQEMEKLDRWADDKRRGLKDQLKKVDDELKELKKQIRQAASLPAKLKLQRKARQLESKRDGAWREYDGDSQQIEQRKDQLLDQVEARLQMSVSETELFRVRWQVQ